MAEVSPERLRGSLAPERCVLELERRNPGGRPLAQLIRGLARERLAEADRILREIDAAWAPPPFDPILVAQALGIRCVEIDEPWLDDAMICVHEGTLTILFRPHRSEVRTYFTLYHEIAHTLFPNYRYNSQYQRCRRPRIFEPEGQLEHLCDVAAAEFLMPMDLFREDLADGGFGAARVEALCRRYRAPAEAVCLRMVESNLEMCALALVEYRRSRPADPGGASGASTRVTYAISSDRLRARKLYIPPYLGLGPRSCLHRAARSKKLTTGDELVELGRGREQRFHVEALPLTTGRRRHGRSPVLAFFYPLN